MQQCGLATSAALAAPLCPPNHPRTLAPPLAFAMARTSAQPCLGVPIGSRMSTLDTASPPRASPSQAQQQYGTNARKFKGPAEHHHHHSSSGGSSPKAVPAAPEPEEPVGAEPAPAPPAPEAAPPAPAFEAPSPPPPPAPAAAEEAVEAEAAEAEAVEAEA
jgi:hypothetical protein